MTVVFYEFDGLRLPVRASDGYFNASALARYHQEQAGEIKYPSDWLKLKNVQEALAYVSRAAKISQKDLVQIIPGKSDVETAGTFLHPELAILFANWLSPEAGYKVSKIVQKCID